MTSIAAKAIGLDDFDLHARYLPGLHAILPIPVTAVAIGVNKMPLVATLLSLAVTVGLPRLLVQVVRDRGLAAQRVLWTSWGGCPTTPMLRQSDVTAPAVDKERWRKVLGAAAHVHLPQSLQAEASDPADADARYEQVVTFAREETRDDQLLLVENRSYNYDRNLYALRNPALWLAAAGVVVMAAGVLLCMSSRASILTPAIGLGANIVVLVGWLTLVTEDRVRVMADKYAIRLLTVATYRQIDILRDTP
jgi:hypothetical protein